MKKLSFLFGLCFLISSTSFGQLIDVPWPYCNECKTVAPTGQNYEVSVMESDLTTLLEAEGFSGVHVVIAKAQTHLASATVNTKIVAYNKYMLTILSKKGNVLYSGHFSL